MKVCPTCGRSFSDEQRFCADHGIALVEAPPAPSALGGGGLVGRVVAGRYRIEAFVGGGGFGAVYKVRDQRLDDVEALKILKSDTLDQDEAQEVLARFQREAKLLRRLGKKSQHIVGVTNLGEDREIGLFFTMEYVEGGDLKNALQMNQGPFTVERTIAIGRQICSALKAAHEFRDAEAGYPNGVVHRDLKLENVMLRKRAGRDHVKILDFGIAKILGGRTVAMDASGGGPGTPGYSPPEQITDPDAIDHRSDLFPLGVILYRLATGREPWFGRTLTEEGREGGVSWMAVMDKSLREKPIPPRKHLPELPKEFERLVLKLMEKEQSKRYQSAAEVDAALAQLETVGSPATTSATRLAMPSERDGEKPRRRVLPLVGGGAVAVAAGVGAWLALGSRAVELEWAEFEQMVRDGQVVEVGLNGPALEGRSGAPEARDFRVGLSGVGLQELGVRLDELELELVPAGDGSSVRIESDPGSTPRSVAIGDAPACDPCQPGEEVALPAGWHPIRWTDDGPATGTVTVFDEDRAFREETIAVGVAEGTSEAGAGRFFVADGLRLRVQLPRDPNAAAADECATMAAAVTSELDAAPAGGGDARWRALQTVERGLRQGLNSSCGETTAMLDVRDRMATAYRELALGARASDDRPSALRYATSCLSLSGADPECEAARGWAATAPQQVQTPAEPGPTEPARTDPGPTDPVERDPAPDAPVCSEASALSITRFEHLEAAGAVRVDWSVRFAGAPRPVDVELSLRSSTGRTQEVTSSSTGPDASGSETVALDGLGLRQRPDDVTLAVSGTARPRNEAGCPPQTVTASAADLVLARTVVPRSVRALTAQPLRLVEEGARALAVSIELALTGPVGAEWCAVVAFRLRIGDDEHVLGTVREPVSQGGQEQAVATIEPRVSLERGDLPASVPNAARNAAARATVALHPSACGDVGGGAGPARESETAPICLEKYPVGSWQACRQ